MLTGPGGAGTTTLALALALAAAERGTRVSLLTLAADDVLDLLEGDPPPDGLTVHDAPGLARQAMAEAGVFPPGPPWAGPRDLALVAVAGTLLTGGPQTGGPQTGGPPADRPELLLVDAGPLPEAISRLTATTAALRLLHRALPMEERLRWVLGPDAADDLDRAASIDGPGDAADRGARFWSPALVDVAERFDRWAAPADQAWGAAERETWLVLPDTAAGHRRAERAWPLLGLSGQPVTRRFYTAGPRGQVDAGARPPGDPLADPDRYPPTPTHPVARTAGPRGRKALVQWGKPLAELVSAPGLPAARPQVQRRPTGPGGEPTGGEGALLEYDFVLPVPGAVRAQVQLERDGDDLLVTLPGATLVVALPSGLRRARAVRARCAGGQLRVTFVLDPDWWEET